ncbi:MAG TPA: hypothetical protein VFA18_20580 [Gemmataceae bacterium]|nr:hypothetical protein [Gemmataceae bacterium]
MKTLKVWLRRALIAIAVLVAGYMGGLLGWLGGMAYGRDYVGGFTFAGLKGMDAAGAVGGILGLLILSCLAGYLSCRLWRPARQ